MQNAKCGCEIRKDVPAWASESSRQPPATDSFRHAADPLVGTPLRGVRFSPDIRRAPDKPHPLPHSTVIPRILRPVGISCLGFQVSVISLNIEKPKMFNVNRYAAMNFPFAGDCLLAKTCLSIAPADSHRCGSYRSPVLRSAGASRKPYGCTAGTFQIRRRSRHLYLHTVFK